MPSTVVHVAFGLLIAAGLLGRAYDRRALAVVAAALVVPDLDTATSLLVESTHRALLHTLLLPAGVALALLVDAHLRDPADSWLRGRYGARGVRVAWVAVVTVVVSGIGLDLATAAGVNLLYPIHDQFYTLTGRASLASDAGFTQTFVAIDPAPADGGGGRVDLGGRGSTAEVHVASGIDPEKGPEPDGVERIFPVVHRGWHLLVVVTAAVVLLARSRTGGVYDGAGRTRER